ncbi:MAG: ATP-binding protein, partial [Gaiellaceae bacterium]
GSVSVELLREGDAAVLMVRDTGPGPAGADEIFEPFVTTRASEHGSGLGLAAARLIARRHGGDVELRETSADGSVFALRLPLETS